MQQRVRRRESSAMDLMERLRKKGLGRSGSYDGAAEEQTLAVFLPFCMVYELLT
jgi:hypothetical protein